MRLSSLLVVLCVVLLFPRSQSQKSREDEVDVFSSKEVASISPEPSVPDEALLPKIQSVSVKTRIRFRFSRTKISSHVLNPDQGRAQNATFTLRIPNDAFISRFEMRVGNEDKVYRAEIVKAEEARKIYQFAIREGRSVTLGLIEQSKRDFTDVKLKFVIAAKTTLLFSLIYEEQLPRIDNRYDSVLYISPDYKTNKTKFRVEIEIDENIPIKSITVPNFEYSVISNATTINKNSSTKATITWSNYGPNDEGIWIYPENELIVSYTLQNEITMGHVLLRNGYFVHFFAPYNLKPLRKHVIFILDVSDSMGGAKINQTISAMHEILEELIVDQDFFNIITYSSEVEIWSCLRGEKPDEIIPFSASAKCKDEAQNFLDRIVTHGSTNTHDALIMGLEIARQVSSVHKSTRLSKKRRGFRARKPVRSKYLLEESIPPDVQSIIIFLSDGEPTSGIIDKKTILTNVKMFNFNLSIPIFSLAFGDQADFRFMSLLSSRNRGFARRIYEDAEAGIQLEDFYRTISSPVLANMTFRYDTPKGELAKGKLVSNGYSLAFEGQEIISIGILKDWPGKNETLSALNVTATGIGRNGRMSYKVPVKDCTNRGSCTKEETEFDDMCIEKLFVYLTLKEMMEALCDLESGLLDDENDDETTAEVEDLRKRITELGLKHRYVTPFTSMVMRTRSIGEEEMDESDSTLFEPKNPFDVGTVYIGKQGSLLEKGSTEKHTPIPKIRKFTNNFDGPLMIPYIFGGTYNQIDVRNISRFLKNPRSFFNLTELKSNASDVADNIPVPRTNFSIPIKNLTDRYIVNTV